jgi:hypothetical protein
LSSAIVIKLNGVPGIYAGTVVVDQEQVAGIQATTWVANTDSEGNTTYTDPDGTTLGQFILGTTLLVKNSNGNLQEYMSSNLSVVAS